MKIFRPYYLLIYIAMLSSGCVSTIRTSDYNENVANINLKQDQSTLTVFMKKEPFLHSSYYLKIIINNKYLSEIKDGEYTVLGLPQENTELVLIEGSMGGKTYKILLPKNRNKHFFYTFKHKSLLIFDYDHTVKECSQDDAKLIIQKLIYKKMESIK